MSRKRTRGCIGGSIVKTESGFRRLVVLVIAAVLLLGRLAPAAAQEDQSKYELFAGWAFLKDVGDRPTSLPLGWNFSGALNVNRSLGLVVDLGGNYKTGSDPVVADTSVHLEEHTFLGGTRFSFRHRRVVPYLEGLAGASRVGLPGDSYWSVALQVGAGLSWRATDRLSLRAGADFRNIFRDGSSYQQVRIVAGVSFGLGGHPEAIAPVPSGPQSPTASVPGRVPPPPPLVSSPPPRREPEPAPKAADAEPARRPQVPAARSAARQSLELLAQAHDLLKARDYPLAASAFREHLRFHGAGKFTIAVGLYCDTSHLDGLVQESGTVEQLFLLSVRRRGQICYGVYWGLFESGLDARVALDSVPPTLRTASPMPIAVRRLLR